jgi:hypothetical protein
MPPKRVPDRFGVSALKRGINILHREIIAPEKAPVYMPEGGAGLKGGQRDFGIFFI